MAKDRTIAAANCGRWAKPTHKPSFAFLDDTQTTHAEDAWISDAREPACCPSTLILARSIARF